jgi:hypothetical protein
MEDVVIQDIFLKYIIPTLGSMATVYYIGNKIKNALCKQISDLTIEIRTHIGISDDKVKELDEVKEMLTNIILKNNLKV